MGCWTRRWWSWAVVLGTEFGRTLRTNDNDGRDHRNKDFTCLLAEAGIRGGRAYWDTDGRAPPFRIADRVFGSRSAMPRQ